MSNQFNDQYLERLVELRDDIEQEIYYLTKSMTNLTIRLEQINTELERWDYAEYTPSM